MRPLAPSERVQRMELDLLGKLNERHRLERPGDPQLAARLRSFETAFGMQMEMPEALDVKRESAATHADYGLDPENPRDAPTLIASRYFGGQPPLSFPYPDDELPPRRQAGKPVPPTR